MITAVCWLMAGVSIVGTVLNIRKHRASYLLWLITNLFWCVRNWKLEEYPQSAQFGLYAALSIVGLVVWRTKH